MDNASFLAKEAINYDKLRQYTAAIESYTKSAKIILQLIEDGKISESSKDIAQQYLNRVEDLKKLEVDFLSEKKIFSQNVEQIKNVLKKAFSEDENKNYAKALEFYTQTIELCIDCGKLSINDEHREKLRGLSLNALERAEKLKKNFKINSEALSDTNKSTIANNDLSELNLINNLPYPPTFATALYKELDKTERLNKEELKVLAATSYINDNCYVPFLECDLKERFIFSIPFTDKDKVLSLSNNQKKNFKDWMRPDEFMEDPKIIVCIDSGTIKQNAVSDCSFVASLAVLARHEKRFNKKLITNIIYPQNKNKEPIYNPCGKYMIQLFINGIWRKVVIDDKLPIGVNGELLCSHSQDKNELWVSLLEKAYMKVMGGFDFPGSNSIIDLNALTGWIPERIPIKKNSDFNKTFERLFTRFHQGDCLITLATGDISETEQKRTGLVDRHAYAVLDLRKVKEKCLLLVKNPWTHLRWKGRFSANDLTSWTTELCSILNYNPKDAQQKDDGVFWIDYESVNEFFDVFCVNWNPKIFPFNYTLHSYWDAGVGPVKDLYTVGDNPQYLLEVDNQLNAASVWILLTRHITDKDDFANNKEFITIIVYKSGKRIYIPHDPKPISDATRINSPHYLCKLMIKESGLQKYTLVVAQYQKMKTIYYTLKIYSTASFKCGLLKTPYKFDKNISGEWRGQTAGGCGNGDSYLTHENNPKYYINLEDGSDENKVLIELRGPKEYSIGFDVFQISTYRTVLKKFENQNSGNFRSGYTVLQLESLPAGSYGVKVMTFLQNQEGPFILRVASTCNFSITQ